MDVDVERAGHGRAALAQRGVEGLGLLARAREAVEDGALDGVRLSEPGERRTGWPGRQAPARRAPCSRPRRVPSFVSSRAAARNRSPEAMCGRPVRSARIAAWVPLPAPGAPIMTYRRISASPDEALVVAHHELRLDLLHGLHDDGDDDQEGRAAEAEAAQDRAREERRDDRGETATMPRKRAPARLIRVTTLAR